MPSGKRRSDTRKEEIRHFGQSSQLSKILFDSLDDIQALFQSLVSGGAVTVTLLVPCGTGESVKPTYLEPRFWSRQRKDALGFERFEHREGRLTFKKSFAGYVFLTRRSVLIKDTRWALDGSPHFELTYGKETLKYIRSLIYVPVTINRTPVFVLSIDCSEPAQFHPAYIEIARSAADLLALVCQIAELLPEYPAEEEKDQEEDTAQVSRQEQLIAGAGSILIGARIRLAAPRSSIVMRREAPPRSC